MPTGLAHFGRVGRVPTLPFVSLWNGFGMPGQGGMAYGRTGAVAMQNHEGGARFGPFSSASDFSRFEGEGEGGGGGERKALILETSSFQRGDLNDRFIDMAGMRLGAQIKGLVVTVGRSVFRIPRIRRHLIGLQELSPASHRKALCKIAQPAALSPEDAPLLRGPDDFSILRLRRSDDAVKTQSKWYQIFFASPPMLVFTASPSSLGGLQPLFVKTDVPVLGGMLLHLHEHLRAEDHEGTKHGLNVTRALALSMEYRQKIIGRESAMAALTGAEAPFSDAAIAAVWRSLTHVARWLEEGNDARVLAEQSLLEAMASTRSPNPLRE